MKKPDAREKLLFLLYVVGIIYVVMNTGIISDDFEAMARLRGKDFIDILVPKGVFYFIETPLSYFTHYIWYYFFSLDNSAAVNIFKIFYVVLSFYLIYRFFKIYLNGSNALLVSFLFIFFPSHDSTTYWFMGQYLMLSIAFYLYAFYMAHRDRLIPAFFFALAASFISYGSPAIALALVILFFLSKEFKKGMVLLIPNVIFSVYYIFLSKIRGIGVDKIPREIDIYEITKQFILQVLTFIDATLGPSMVLKVWYSFPQLKAASFVIGVLGIVIFYKTYQKDSTRPDAKLALSLTILTFISFLIFAATGLYPQLAFNLGNRTTIFGSLLLAYSLVVIPMPHKVRTLIFALILFTALGISDHWKDWNTNQQAVIKNIRNNRALRDYKDTKVIYVSGNQYSKYGPISHIEFLTEGYVSHPLFQLVLEKDISVHPINKTYVYKDGYLVDTRYNFMQKVDSYINVYDSERNRFFSLEAEKINDYIDSMPQEKRHWIQMVDLPLIRNIAIRLMPRLKKTL